MAVHMTQLNEQEIELVAKQGVHVLHCPESNLKLNSGYCPVNHLRRHSFARLADTRNGHHQCREGT